MDNIWKSIIRAVFVLIGLSPVAMVIYFALFRSLTKEYVLIVVGAELAILIFLFGVIVLYALAVGELRLDRLVNEANGDASMSRFQLLIFTFTIALSFVYLVLYGPGKFPDIPKEVLILLGISASTYGVGKGLQVVSDSSTPPGTPNEPPVEPAGTTNSQPKPPGDVPAGVN